MEWRNTPSEQLGPSPAQLLFGRRTRTRLPTAGQLLDTPTSHAASAALAVAKDRQAFYYNRNAKERPPLSVGQTVRVKYNDKESEWRKAEVADVLPYPWSSVLLAPGESGCSKAVQHGAYCRAIRTAANMECSSKLKISEAIKTS